MRVCQDLPGQSAELPNEPRLPTNRSPGDLSLTREGGRHTVLRKDEVEIGNSGSIESCLSTVRHVTRNVKRWQRGDHIARWTAAGLLEAEKKFRRVKGYRELAEFGGKLNPELHSQQQVA